MLSSALALLLSNFSLSRDTLESMLEDIYQDPSTEFAIQLISEYELELKNMHFYTN